MKLLNHDRNEIITWIEKLRRVSLCFSILISISSFTVYCECRVESNKSISVLSKIYLFTLGKMCLQFMISERHRKSSINHDLFHTCAVFLSDCNDIAIIITEMQDNCKKKKRFPSVIIAAFHRIAFTILT